MLEEIWKPIYEYRQLTRYEVSSLGRVRRIVSSTQFNLLKPINRKGTYYVNIYHNDDHYGNYRYARAVKLLVARAFIWDGDVELLETRDVKLKDRSKYPTLDNIYIDVSNISN